MSFYGPTAKAVRAKMNAARGRLEAGAPVKDAARCVGDWLTHWRATTLAASDRKETTRGAVRESVAQAPRGGAVRCDRAGSAQGVRLEALVLTLRGRGLSDSTVRSVYTVLRAGLDGAVRDGLIARNPAALVTRPGVARREARHLGADDVMAVLRAAEASRYHPALVLIASTGLRRGECLALSWDRVDLDAGVLRVAATIARVAGRLVITEPKTDRARRTVPLSPAVVGMLRRHRTEQKAERLRAGNQWTDSGLVFTTELGGPVDPRNLLRVIEAPPRPRVWRVSVCTRCGTARRWTGSRRACTSRRWRICRASSISITGDVYGHTSDDTARAAVDGLAGRLGL